MKMQISFFFNKVQHLACYVWWAEIMIWSHYWFSPHRRYVEAGLALIWRENPGGNEHMLNQVFITNDAMHIKLVYSDIW